MATKHQESMLEGLYAGLIIGENKKNSAETIKRLNSLLLNHLSYNAAGTHSFTFFINQRPDIMGRLSTEDLSLRDEGPEILHAFYGETILHLPRPNAFVSKDIHLELMPVILPRGVTDLHLRALNQSLMSRGMYVTDTHDIGLVITDDGDVSPIVYDGNAIAKVEDIHQPGIPLAEGEIAALRVQKDIKAGRYLPDVYDWEAIQKKIAAKPKAYIADLWKDKPELSLGL